MANAYIHLDSIDTLEQYRHKLESWKRDTLYKLADEIRLYHEGLQQDQKWYGQSHEEFKEQFADIFYNKFFQPAAELMDEAQKYLRNLQNRAEELGIK
jgi:hypothetical protein